jgi:nucleoid DNA-binding protein
MIHRQLVSAVASRFPDLTQRQIEEVLEVLVELWRRELEQPGGEIIIRDFGKLTVDVQQMRNAGAVRAQMGSQAPEYLARLYFRFRPAPEVRAQVERHVKEKA